MKRLLCIVSNLNQGGAETFLMKVYRHLNRNEYQMDFCVMSDISGTYEKEALSLGANIYHITAKSKSVIKCLYSIQNIVKTYGYKYVIRVNEHSLSVLDLLAAKFGGATVLAMRSSNADSGSTRTKILHRMFKLLPIIVPNVKIAPSDKAAEYTFGKRAVEKHNVNMLRNGIPIDEYTFSEVNRTRYIKEFNLDGKLVIGHVGRFCSQKNHMFLLDVFREISKRNDRAYLILIGDGELRHEIERKIEQNSLKDKVLLLGKRNDVPALLSAMDLLLFPSLYEGMPNVVIEAQAAGLPCVISDTITKEADITGLVQYISLENGAQIWADACQKIIEEKPERKNAKDCFIENKYDIQSVVDEFVRLVF